MGGFIKTACAGGGGGGGTPSYPGNDFELFFRNSDTLASSPDMMFDDGFLKSKGLKINNTVVAAPVNGQLWFNSNQLSVRSDGTTYNLLPPKLNGHVPRASTAGNLVYVAEFRYDNSTLRSQKISAGDYSTITDSTFVTRSTSNTFATKNIQAKNQSDAVIFDLRNNGNIGINQDAAAGTLINVAESSEVRSQMNFNAGANVTSPSQGDLWYNGTQLFFRTESLNYNLLSPNAPEEDGWIPRSNTSGDFVYDVNLKYTSGQLFTPTMQLGVSPSNAAVLLNAKTDQSNFNVPIINIVDNFDQTILNVRANGRFGFGTAATAGALLNLDTSFGGGAAIRFSSGNPATPQDGDMWRNGDLMYIRLAGVTKQFALV